MNKFLSEKVYSNGCREDAHDAAWSTLETELFSAFLVSEESMGER
ncbi:MAG TPA: hypothetical protein VK716_03895 [Terracidiphilus sp.]|jgi:hypothetical protein|nr:hypothetical protein [Terracidiphilus sp.]